MCKDLPSVKAVAAAGLNIPYKFCRRGKDPKCPHLDPCPEIRNRREVDFAQVVVAHYDAIFTDVGVLSQEIALVLVNEACWARSFATVDGLTVESLGTVELAAPSVAGCRDAEGSKTADLLVMRANWRGPWRVWMKGKSRWRRCKLVTLTSKPAPKA